jgi:ATP-dependent helicase Lhr and Lhr-like helicase
VSAGVDHARLLGNVRAIVVDEVHAFAGDDRGWHLLAVLERLTHLVGHPIQRIGLSATIGNPSELLRWLQGAGSGHRLGQVIAPADSGWEHLRSTLTGAETLTGGELAPSLPAIGQEGPAARQAQPE